MSLINTAITGIRVSQLALSTTGNNIVNANTDGYTRQSVATSSAQAIKTGAGYLGTGVLATDIFRNTEKHLVDQVNRDIAQLSDLDTYLSNISKLDNLFAGENTNLSLSINKFFDAINESANDPASLLGRQLLLTESKLLLDNFSQIENRLLDQGKALNGQIDAIAANVGTIANELAEMNASISYAMSSSTAQMPNDLLDKRDQLLRELARYVDIETIARADGTMDVSIGQGQPLVIGQQARQLVAVPGESNPQQREFGFQVGNNVEVVTRLLSGGEAGGLIRFRDEALNPAMNAIGRVALAIVDNVNQQHRLGMDLEGNLGGRVFSDINNASVAADRVREYTTNSPSDSRRISVLIDDVSGLTTSDYELSFSGPSGRYNVVRLSDGKVVGQGMLGQSRPAEIEVEGFTVRIEAGNFQAGDRFRLQPTRMAGSQTQMEITRPEEFAFASPIRTEAGVSNQGGATISAGVVSSVDTSAFDKQGQLNPPVMIRFTSPTTYDVLDVSDPARPVPLNPPLMDQPFVPGALVNVFPEDPGGTTVSSAGDASERLQQSTVNGYGPETLTIETTDPRSGFIQQQFMPIAANESAASIAARLSALDGVSATASSRLTLSGFTASTNGDSMTLSLNGEDLTDTSFVFEGESEPREVPDPLTADYLRDRINADPALAAKGIFAISDGQQLTVRSSQGVDLSFVLGGGSVNVGDDNVTVSGPGAEFTVGGRVDVRLASDTTLTSTDATGVFGTAPEAVSNYTGYQVTLRSSASADGRPAAGDRFHVRYNHNGTSDNRNGSALLDLNTTTTLSRGNLTYQGAYGQMVEELGILTSQTRLTQQSSESMLRQSMDALMSMSGVNIEEEAARLIQLEQHYNASARLIGLARDLFDTLLQM
jgi:flagellar hook-associated protein 1 FlgK